jgi:BirA family biotin operon repressor/biotin-[acetyl-CoA-carboxylase] ligase
LTCIADSKQPSAGRPRAPVLSLDPALIGQQAPQFDIEAVQQTASTNADLIERVRRGQPARPLLRAALHQTAGRGRHGRRWFASPGGALLFSLAVPMAADGARIAAATLACGVGAAEALRAAGAPVTIKWPNDLLLDGRKLGGVLCELGTDAQGRRTLVVGVGVNVHLEPAVRDSIGQPAASLGETAAAALSREALIARLAVAIAEALRLFDARGFVPLQPRFMALFAHRDATVELLEMGVRAAAGRALGVDGEGRLLIDTGNGLRACGSGEVSLRRLP